MPSASQVKPTVKVFRHSAVVRATHWLTFIAFIGLLISGGEIVIPHPRFYWGEEGNVNTKPLFVLPIPASRDTVPTSYHYVLADENGWGRSLHFESAWLVVLTGLVYGIYGLASGHFRKNLLPPRRDWTWRAYSNRIARYLRRKPPNRSEETSYNILQRSAYLGVIFVLFPLMIWTGLAMSPSFTSVFPSTAALLGGRQSARTIHFFVSWLLLFFLVVHVTMVSMSGFWPRLRSMIYGIRATFRGGLMSPSKKLITRRKLIYGGLATAAGVGGLAVADRMAKRYGLVPPDAAGIYGPGETLTYACQRVLTAHRPAREFPRSMISKNPFANEVAPPTDAFKKLHAGGFKDWHLVVDGTVAHPLVLSLADLKSMPVHSQITEVACEEGWSYIAEWIGTPLSEVLREAGVLPQSRYVVYYPIEKGLWESIDMADAMHPYTLLTMGMNDGDLPVPFGGPLRLRLPRQLGYKSLKYLTHITVTDDIRKFGNGKGSVDPDYGYTWYAGI